MKIYRLHKCVEKPAIEVFSIRWDRSQLEWKPCSFNTIDAYIINPSKDDILYLNLTGIVYVEIKVVYDNTGGALNPIAMERIRLLKNMYLEKLNNESLSVIQARKT